MKQEAESIQDLVQSLNCPSEDKPKSAPTAYYRSNIYTAKAGINPLVTASQPILSFLDRIQRSEKLADTDTVKQNLNHEVQAFEAHANSFEYDEDIITAARFMLCITLDDMLGRAKWTNNNSWDKYRFVPKLDDAKHSPDEGFFLLLDRIKETPEPYLDLIELAYLCLSLGFEGKYHNIKAGHKQLDAILDSLYDLIRDHRRENTTAIFITVDEQQKRKTLPSKALLWLYPILCGGLLITLYFSFNYMLNLNAQSVVDKIDRILHPSSYDIK